MPKHKVEMTMVRAREAVQTRRGAADRVDGKRSKWRRRRAGVDVDAGEAEVEMS